MESILKNNNYSSVELCETSAVLGGTKKLHRVAQSSSQSNTERITQICPEFNDAVYGNRSLYDVYKSMLIYAEI
jgi:hypothetical protein